MASYISLREAKVVLGLEWNHLAAEGSHRGLVRPPAKRVGGVEPPRGFESRTLRHSRKSCPFRSAKGARASEARSRGMPGMMGGGSITISL